MVAGDKGGVYRKPSDISLEKFTEVLKKEGCFVCLRKARGDGEDAACGMLATKRKERAIK